MDFNPEREMTKEESFQESDLDFYPPLDPQSIQDIKFISPNESSEENVYYISAVKNGKSTVSNPPGKRPVTVSQSPERVDADESSLTQKPSIQNVGIR